jgi:hypothetical protein
MKKMLFALALFCEISFGMNPRDTYGNIAQQFRKYSYLCTKWRVEFSDYGSFEKEALLNLQRWKRRGTRPNRRTLIPLFLKL